MIREAIQSVVSGKSLTIDEAAQVMTEIMEGQVTPAQFGAFVTALRLKGETIEEIAGLARTMRAKALRVNVTGPVIDVVGTGGDGLSSFNISTTTAFVVAGAGLKVAKHGNRAASSQCGAADVLEALSVKFNLNAEQVQRCIEEVGIGFMFAPSFHPATKFASGPRKEIGIRNVFNILGPLTNPAFAKYYLLGVADGSQVEKMALVLQSLGCSHAMVVHGEDGLDEISISGPSLICEVRGDTVKSYRISPENFGLGRASLENLKGDTAAHNAAILRSVLWGDKGPRRDVVLLNASAALVAGEKAQTLDEGIETARQSIDSGRALEKLEQLVKLSNSFT
jgi:anthranilate phosphoribosyltransferase